jgi:hypothetical protein
MPPRARQAMPVMSAIKHFPEDFDKPSQLAAE